MPNFAAISQTVAEIWLLFQYDAVRNLGFVVLVCFTTHEDHLVVFIVVQNLVGIGAPLSIICMISVTPSKNVVLGNLTLRQISYFLTDARLG